MYDVVIVGGSAAGLSAGMILGRFRRKVLICDSGKPRNAPSQGVHGFLSRDGITPQELMQISREQLKPYTTVELVNTEVTQIIQQDNQFEVVLADGSRQVAGKILLATGVKDELPDIEGLSELWAKSVYHCPYCHGWEARDKAIAILAGGEMAVHLSKLLFALSDDIVICTNGEGMIEPDTAHMLSEAGIRIINTSIQSIRANDDTLEAIVFEDGMWLEREAIFVKTIQHQHSGLAAQLGCVLDAAGRVQVDSMGKTSVEGVFAAGDLSSPMQQVIMAAAQGATAAAHINNALAQEAFAVREQVS